MLLHVSVRGGNLAHCMLGCRPPPLPAQCMLEYGQQAGGTHSTGMQSCKKNFAVAPASLFLKPLVQLEWMAFHIPQPWLWENIGQGSWFRVLTRPGKMRVHLENLEISWNFEKFNKYHGKMT